MKNELGRKVTFELNIFIKKQGLKSKSKSFARCGWGGRITLRPQGLELHGRSFALAGFAQAHRRPPVRLSLVVEPTFS